MNTELKEKERIAMERLKAFEPEDGYFLAYSGGKDSDCIKILTQLAGVKFEAVHNLTTVDAPETVRYIKSQLDVRIDRPYTNSPMVSCTKLSPNHSGQRTHSIDRITPHCVVGQCSVETLGNVFLPKSRQASSNYGIGVDGRVGMYVEEKNRSWCSSSAANDQRAVTIECASDSKAPYAFKDVVYEKLIQLCTDICKRNGKTKLLWLGDKDKTLSYTPAPDEMVLTVHRWFADKSCPGNWMYARMGDLAEKVTAALGNQTQAPLDNAPAAWSKDAVNWALENRLLLGDSNGNLKLRENLTREQFCVMLKRYHDMLQK